MPRRLSLLLACLALLVSLGCRQEAREGSPPEAAQAADAAADQGYHEAADQAQKDYREAATFDDKLAVLRDFLVRYPEAEDLGDVLQMVTNDALEAERPEAAAAFIDEALERIENPDKRFEARLQLASLLGKTGKRDELRALVAELGEEHELRYRDLYAIVEAAIAAEDWDLAAQESQASLAFATPAHYQEDSPEVSDADAQRYGTRRVAYSLAFEAWAQYNLGRTEEAFESFRRAEESADHNVLGIDATPLHRYWGRALLRQGQAEKAMDVLASEALFGRGDEALATYREAWEACHDGADGFDEHLSDLRLASATKVPDFALPNYQGETVHLSQFAGDVVLLTFWFPT